MCCTTSTSEPAYLQKVASYVKPSGRIAVIELDATKPDASHRDQKELQVTREELDTWMKAAGLRKIEEISLFEDKWFVIYGKDGGKIGDRLVRVMPVADSRLRSSRRWLRRLGKGGGPRTAPPRCRSTCCR